MHPRTKAQGKELTKLILELVAAGALASVAAGLATDPRRSGKALDALSTFAAWRIRRAFARLKMQGMITYSERDVRSPLYLTKKGIARLTRYELRGLRLFDRRKKWDYLWRLVIFDVPERQRWLRDALRYELGLLGFFQLQQSVYVAPFDCTQQIETISETLWLRKRLMQCVTPSLGRYEDRVRSHFIAKGTAPKNLRRV